MPDKMKLPYLGVNDVAEIIGLTPRQVRNIAPLVPGAFQNSSGWQIPPSGVKWIKSRKETRGRKPLKKRK